MNTLSDRSTSDVCVVHLVWAPLGLDPFRAFLDSYRRHPAGLAHRLLIVFNGFASRPEAEPYLGLLEGTEHAQLWLSQPVQDIAAYLHAAESCPERWLCFLNSYSVILGANWLRKMTAHVQTVKMPLVGATGSWESYEVYLREWHRSRPLPRWWTPHGLRTQLRRWWDELLARRHFPPFPNPHLRTNAFLVERAFLRSLRPGKIRTKMQALRFEGGRHSLTVHAVRAGFHPCLVDREGRAWQWQDWAVSRIFRSGNQENLLVADNRTRDYEHGSPAERRTLARYAWGEETPI